MVRRVLAVVLLAACDGAPSSVAGLDGGSLDARLPAGDAAAGAPDAGLMPSPANHGWIGGACSAPTDCPFTDGMCLRDGFPNGMCTEECSGLCPDRGQPGDTLTACVDGRPFGFDQGLCVSRCDLAFLPPTGCPAGYRCLPKNRYSDPSTVFSVCVPSVPAGSCHGADEIIHVAYPDSGALWIPAEAQCGGAFPVVVMLHGINPAMNATPSLGGGRHLEYEVRSLIDAGLMKPVILAEPVQLDADSAGSAGLYSAAHFDPAHHLDLLKAELDRKGVSLASLSYTGHSGAGCDSRNGLYLILSRFAMLIPKYAPVMKLWGLEDICYAGSYHWTAPMQTLGGTGTAIINIFSVQGDPTAFENGLIPVPAELPCASANFTKCIRHQTQPWCSYRTRAPIDHDANPYFFVREAFPQVFAVDPTILPCR